MASTSSQVLDSLMCAHNPTEILSRSFATRPKTLPRDDRLYIYRLSCHIVGDVKPHPWQRSMAPSEPGAHLPVRGIGIAARAMAMISSGVLTQ